MLPPEPVLPQCYPNVAPEPALPQCDPRARVPNVTPARRYTNVYPKCYPRAALPQMLPQSRVTPNVTPEPRPQMLLQSRVTPNVTPEPRYPKCYPRAALPPMLPQSRVTPNVTPEPPQMLPHRVTMLPQLPQSRVTPNVTPEPRYPKCYPRGCVTPNVTPELRYPRAALHQIRNTDANAGSAPEGARETHIYPSLALAIWKGPSFKITRSKTRPDKAQGEANRRKEEQRQSHPTLFGHKILHKLSFHNFHEVGEDCLGCSMQTSMTSEWLKIAQNSSEFLGAPHSE